MAERAERFAGLRAPKISAVFDWLKQNLPEGRTLPPAAWDRRHRGIITILWLHPPLLFLFGLVMRQPLLHVIQESFIVVVFATFASLPDLPRRVRATLTSLGLLASSAILVHFSGGYIEFHF